MKQGEKDYLKEHSKEKVSFYRKYLDLYLTILLNSKYTKVINIYDIFCGVGLYSGDSSKGSPIMAMESIIDKLEIFNNSKHIRLLINDGDKERVKRAQKYIKNTYNKQFEFEDYNLLSEEIFKLIISKIKKTKDENHFIFCCEVNPGLSRSASWRLYPLNVQMGLLSGYGSAGA